jgi:hypothetical protein
MDKQAVITHIETLVESFKRLDKETKKENASTERFLLDQLEYAKNGMVNYSTVWSPMALYKMKGDTPSISIREYRMNHGDSTDLIEGFEEIRVAKSDGSGYLAL